MRRVVALLAIGIGIVVEGAILYPLYHGQYRGYYPLVVLAAVFLVALGYLYKEAPSFSWPASETLTDIACVSVIGMAFLLYNRADLTSWYYSAIGDEYAFFDQAKSIAEGTAAPNFFTNNGVYGLIPSLSSYYQAVVMKIAGINNEGWKTSLIVIAAATFYPLFFMVKRLFDRITGYVSVCLFASSHYLWGYVHTGYSNIDSIFPTTAALYFLVRGVLSQRVFFLFCSGIFSGLGFYTFYSSRVTLAIAVPVLFLSAQRFHLRKSLPPYLLGLSMAVLPMLMTDGYGTFSRMAERGIMNPYPPTSKSLIELMWGNFLTSLTAFNYNPYHGPYVTGSLLDPVSGVLFVIGGIWALWNVREFRSQLLVIWYSIGLFTTGVMSQYHATGNVSRLHYLLPVVSALSGIGLTKMLGNLRLFKSAGFKLAVVSPVLVGALMLNVYRFRVQTPARLDASRQALAVRAIDSPVCSDQSGRPIIIEPQPDVIVKAVRSLRVTPEPKILKYGEKLSPKDISGSCIIFSYWDDEEAKKLIRLIESGRPQEKKTHIDGYARADYVIVLSP